MTSLEIPAKERILAAALEEFANRGYEASSTNAIAARARVAKGLVFHHFQSKEHLFAELFDTEIRRFSERVFDFEAPLSPDLFERLYQVTVLKLKVAAEKPLMVEFLLVALTEAPPALKTRLVQTQAEFMQKMWPRFMEGINSDRLAPGVTLMDAIDTVSVLSEGLEKRLTLLMKSRTVTLEQASALAWKHFERLRDGVYRKP